MDGHPPVRVSSPRPTSPGKNESLHQSTEYDFRSGGLLETCQYEVVSQIDRSLYRAAEVIPLAWRSSVLVSLLPYYTLQYWYSTVRLAWLRVMVLGT